MSDKRIPRPRNAFILFRQHNHRLLIEEWTTQGVDIPHNSKISKILGSRWKALSDEERGSSWHARRSASTRKSTRTTATNRLEDISAGDQGPTLFLTIATHREPPMWCKCRRRRQVQCRGGLLHLFWRIRLLQVLGVPQLLQLLQRSQEHHLRFRLSQELPSLIIIPTTYRYRATYPV